MMIDSNIHMDQRIMNRDDNWDQIIRCCSNIINVGKTIPSTIPNFSPSIGGINHSCWFQDAKNFATGDIDLGIIKHHWDQRIGIIDREYHWDDTLK